MSENKKTVTAQQVKELRGITGAGILDSKKALEATSGNIDKAIIWLQEKGVAKAAKKSSRIAAEGLVRAINKGNNAVIVEINSETDFVALNDKFKTLIDKVANKLLTADFSSDAEAEKVEIEKTTIGELCNKATATIGEKISFRRANKIVKTDSQNFGSYVHANGKIASIVVIEGGNPEAAKNVSMQVAAMNPGFLNAAAMPKKVIDSYKEEIMKELEGMNKPEKIKEKMAEGKLRKVLSELTLVDQPFVMETKQSVSQYLKSVGASIVSMTRFEVGEGIEKNQVDFADEVAQQMAK